MHIRVYKFLTHPPALLFRDKGHAPRSALSRFKRVVPARISSALPDSRARDRGMLRQVTLNDITSRSPSRAEARISVRCKQN